MGVIDPTCGPTPQQAKTPDAFKPAPGWLQIIFSTPQDAAAEEERIMAEEKRTGKTVRRMATYRPK